MNNNFIKIIPGKKYGMTNGGKVNKKPPTIKRAPALSKPRKPKKMANGKKLVAKSYSKGGSGCGCGGSMSGKVKSHQQGGVVGQTGTDIDTNEFNTTKLNLFPGNQPAAASSGGYNVSSDQPKIPNQNSVKSTILPTAGTEPFKMSSFLKSFLSKQKGLLGVAGSGVKDMLKDQKQRRQAIGFDTSNPTNALTNETMNQFGSNKQQGSSTKVGATGERMFQGGGVVTDDAMVGDDDEDRSLVEAEGSKFSKEMGSYIDVPNIDEDYIWDPIQHLENNYSRPEDILTVSNMLPDETVKEEVVGIDQSSNLTPAHPVGVASILEDVFGVSSEGQDFKKMMRLLGRFAQTESYRGKKTTNPKSSARGVFHFLTGNGGQYNKYGKPVKNGGYNQKGERVKSSFDTAKTRLSNLLGMKEFKGKFDKLWSVNQYRDRILNAKSPEDLSNQEQALLAYADLKMRKGTDLKDWLAMDDYDDDMARDMYKRLWVTNTDSKDQSEEVLDRNWLNAIEREKTEGYYNNYATNRKFFGLPMIQELLQRGEYDYDYGRKVPNTMDVDKIMGGYITNGIPYRFKKGGLMGIKVKEPLKIIRESSKLF